MDYGKSAYLKIYELESKLNSLQKEGGEFSSCIELSKPSINQDFGASNPITVDFLEFVPKSKTICFQFNIHLGAALAGKVKASVIVNGLVISEESKALTAGENDFLIIKTFSPLGSDPIKVSLTLEAEGQAAATLKGVDFVVLGADGESASTDIEFRAALAGENAAIISYIDDGKLYYLRTTLEPKTFSLDDFTYYGEAESHCFCKASYALENMNLFRVDKSKNLYVSSFPTRSERLLATGVDSVFACTCPATMTDSNLVLFVKNGECYYKTLREEGEVVERKLPLPKGEYCSVYAVSHPDSEFVYIIATTLSGSNYILKSIIEVSTGKITEFLNADYSVALTKYIDMGMFKSQLSDKLTCTFSLDFKSVFEYDKVFERVSFDHLNAESSFNASKYKVVKPVNYGVYIDLAKYRDPLSWVTYTDDAAGFLPAVMNTETGVLNDNGWLDRWPFDSLRSCVIKDGKVVGYLNKNNYKEFEDGTPSNITNKETGDVMVEFPEIYYRIARDPETQNILVNISNKDLPGYTKDAFVYKGVECSRVYISAYNSSGRSSQTGFQSYSGDTCSIPASNLSFEALYDNLRKFSPRENFEFLTFRLYYLLQILYLIMFRTTRTVNYYTSIFSSASESIQNGTCDDKGMYYGRIQTTYQANHSNKLFGLENLFGVRRQVATGIRSDDNGRFHVINPYDPNGVYDYRGQSGFVEVEGDYTLPLDSYKIAIDVNAINELGFLHVGSSSDKYTTTAFTGFCDDTRMRPSCYCIITGYGSTKNKSGLFAGELMGRGASIPANVSGRLVYFPINTGE